MLPKPRLGSRTKYVRILWAQVAPAGMMWKRANAKANFSLWFLANPPAPGSCRPVAKTLSSSSLAGLSILQQLQMQPQTFNHRHGIAEFFIASCNEPL